VNDQLPDDALAKFFVAADEASISSQRRAVIAVRVRLISAVVAASSGTFALLTGAATFLAFMALTGFVLALVAELYLIVDRPERRWYQARAGAESIKTLSWRFAVGADPFFPDLSAEDAAVLFRSRVSDVARQISDSVVAPEGDAAGPTTRMVEVRSKSFADRRDIYLSERTERQRDWYVRKAKVNRRRAGFWRIFLIVAELVAVVLAAGAAFASWSIDAAGLLAALIGAAAGWLSFRQHSTLQAAYALTGVELGQQVGVLRRASEADWASAVADAEEAISREHTMWLASRGDVNENV
jgi:hypothetical protein